MSESDVMERWQYYYRVNECTAKDVFGPNCICWHEEGSGPFSRELHTDAATFLEWRNPALLKRDN